MQACRKLDEMIFISLVFFFQLTEPDKAFMAAEIGFHEKTARQNFEIKKF